MLHNTASIGLCTSALLLKPLSWLQDMSITKGVRIEDMGHKMGCNGVDNGKLWFDGAPPPAAVAPSCCRV